MSNNSNVMNLTKFPFELVVKIINYTGIISFRNGIFINAIPKTDPRYEMLKQIKQPKLYVFGNKKQYGSVFIGFSNKKYILCYSFRSAGHSMSFCNQSNKNTICYKKSADSKWYQTVQYYM